VCLVEVDAITADGWVDVFIDDSDAFLRDRRRRTARRVGVTGSGLRGTGLSYRPELSRHGSVVRFVSGASNWSARHHRVSDVFVRG
jgi:hypothetical protein